MAPPWMPQNIQKRLLRYVLQQLSLFSEIDLLNLDVSLGTNSKIVLREVQLDSEKICIPGVFLRDGKVNNLELLLTVAGGVQIEARGVEMILAPSTNTATTRKGKFSLAQSTADLANSIMMDKYDDDVIDDEDEDDDKADSSSDLSSLVKPNDDTNPSRLNAVMTRAAELALARLKVELFDINITVIADLVTVAIHIDHVSFNSADGIRSIKFENMELTLVTPKLSPGDGEHLEATADESMESEESEDDDNDPYDDDNDDMMSSSFLGDRKESLMDSMVFSHEEASSLYMSATSNLLKSSFDKQKTDAPTRLLHLNEGEITFQGFQDIEDSNISIDEVNIAATPWPMALSGLLHTVKRLLRLDNLQRQKNKNGLSKPPIRIDIETPNDADSVNSEDDESDDLSMLFDNVSINKISLDFNSLLSQNGVFSTDDSLRLILQNVKVAQESNDQYRGYIDLLQLSHKDEVILQLNQSLGIDELDIIFKYDKFKDGKSDMRIAISKPIHIDLDYQSVAKVLKFVKHLEPLFDYLESQSSSSSLPTATTQPRSLRNQLDAMRYNIHQYDNKVSTLDADPIVKFQFLTESIELNLQMTSGLSLKTVILPVEFNNVQNALNIEEVLLHLSIGSDLGIEMMSIKNIAFKNFIQDELVKTFGITSSNKFEVSNLNTSSRLDIDTIKVVWDYKNLQKFLNSINSFQSNLSNLLSPSTTSLETGPIFNSSKPKKKVRLNNTTFFQKSLSMFVNLSKLNISINNINNDFGDICLKLDNVTANIFKNSSLYQLFVMNGSIHRVMDNVEREQCFGIASVEDNKSPIIGARARDMNIISLYFRNVILDYYTEWLSFFDNAPNKTPPVETPTVKLPDQAKKRFEIRTSLSDCVIGLNPGRLTAKALVVVKKGNADLYFDKELSIKSSLKTLSVLLIDDVANILSDTETKNIRQWNNLRNNNTMNAPSWSQVSYFIFKGYVSVLRINAIHSSIIFNNEANLRKLKTNSPKSVVDMKINSDTWNVELCADSAQCLISLLNDLKQPVNITFQEKYKPNVDDEIDIFDEIEPYAYQKEEINVPSLQIPTILKSGGSSLVDSYHGSINSSSVHDIAENDELGVDNLASEIQNLIIFNDQHFDNKSNETLSESVTVYPISIYVCATKIVINLYDGYDWKETRKTISGVFKRVQAKVAELLKNMAQEEMRLTDTSEPPSRGSTRRDSFGDMGFLPEFNNDDEIFAGSTRMVGETLYDSIILSMPVNSDVASLSEHINRGLGASDDNDSVSDSKSINNNNNNVNSDPTIDLGKHTGKKLRLRRSKYQKVSVELHDLDFEMTIFTTFDPTRDPLRPQDSLNMAETINSMDIKLREFMIIDNVPTSTWNRFATYMTEAGIKEIGVSMFHLKIDTVRPVSSLALTELIMDVNVLPLSLHVDQDTLDFLTRFGEFKDQRFLLLDLYEDIIYIQKFTCNAVRIKLDYKPKKIDYNGIRSGHTSEFMNFFILDEAEMVLKKVSIYGISGFPRLNKMLNDCWMPDIKSTQLSGVLAGLAPVRSIVKIGSGFKDLVAVPVKEYKKDGRVVRSLQQGAYVFAKTTSNELLKFGVKLAAGTQTLLENAEGALGGEGSSGRLSSFRKDQNSDEQLFAITTVRRGREKPNMEASLIGRNAYGSDQIGKYRKALDSFEEGDDSEDEFSMSVKSTKSGMPFDPVLGDDEQDDEELMAVFKDLDDDERQKFVSLYADQPHTMREGILAAYSSLGRNLSTARDALRDAGSSISDSGTAKDALIAIAKATPVAVIRPMIGTTELISQALLGGMNQLDPTQRLKAEEKYKSSSM